MALTLLGMAGLSLRTEAQQIEELIQWTDNWIFNESGDDLGTAWREFDYSPGSGWSSPSPGLLGREPDTPEKYTSYAPISTPLTSPQQGGPITVYLRHTFQYNGTTTGLLLFTTNLIDDGCVIYLNGTEVGRKRVPVGQNFSTTASGGPTEGALEIIQIANAASLIRQGPNVMAVELHQSSASSSDLIYGMKLTAIIAEPLEIVQEPQDLVATVGEEVNLTVGVTGGPAEYQWQKNGFNISGPGARLPTFTIPIAQLTSSGDYRCIITNVLSSLTSRVAVLRVIPDNVGPKILSAVGETNTFRGDPVINIRFNERLTLLTGRNTNNYKIYAGTDFENPIGFTRATYIVLDAPRVFLFVDPEDPNWEMDADMFIVVDNVADTKANNINPNTVVPVSWRVPIQVTETRDVWSFYSSGFFDPTFPAIYEDTAWTEPDYVPDSSLWGTGGGVFFRLSGPAPTVCLGDSLGHQTDFQRTPTLFRTTVNIDTNIIGGEPKGLVIADVEHVVDDGLVLYVNGSEVYRWNMGLGSVLGPDRKASGRVANAVCVEDEATIDNLFVSGANTLAAAVYQAAQDDSDTVFGLSMNATFLRSSQMPEGATGPVEITVTESDGTYMLSWPSDYFGIQLQSSPSTGDSALWLQVGGQSNPYVIPPGELSGSGAKFYRLVIDQ